VRCPSGHALRCCRLSNGRLSSHDLYIEKGRQLKPKLDENLRICQLCKKGIENESHFVIECSIYNSEREILYNAIKNIEGNLNNLDNTYSFKKLFMSKNEYTLFVLAKFLYKCLTKRHQLMSLL
jgi:hypothetical protein